MLKAIVFDFDGVVVDSEPLHYQAFMEVGKEIGIAFDYDEYLQEYIGYDDRDAFRVMMRAINQPLSDGQLQELIQKKQVAFERLVKSGAAAIPGALELIDEAYDQMPIAIGSGATSVDIQLMLEGIGRQDRFEVIVAADRVAHSKPDPETYRLAVKQLADKHPDLALTPADCLVIEDTAAGIESARGAGLMSLGIATTGPASALSRANRVEPGLEGVTLAKLRQWYDE